MSEDGITNVLIVSLIGEILLAIWAWWGILGYWREEGGRASKLWTALVVMSGLAVLSGILTLPIAVIAVLDLPRLPLTAPAVVLILMAQLAAVIAYRLVFDSIRRRGRRIEGTEKESRMDEKPLDQDPDEDAEVESGVAADASAEADEEDDEAAAPEVFEPEKA